jgi:hypothetical protein
MMTDGVARSASDGTERGQDSFKLSALDLHVADNGRPTE